MFSVLGIPVALQLLVPLGLLAWLAFGGASSRLAWVLRLVLVSLYLLLVAWTGLWLVLPWYTPLAYAALWPFAVIGSARRSRGLRRYPRESRAVAGAVALAAAAAVVAVLCLRVVVARRAPAGAVDLAFPLRRGSYLVVNGGNSRLINAHLETLAADERFRRWRGQSYGVDLVGLGRFGFRSRGILPGDPAAYRIFGDSIAAPCAGMVVATQDGMPEMRPPATDSRHLAGNHVILRCGRVWVVMAHLRQGSVAVRAGDSLAVGEPLGLVGNSGNTGEPHLHIHAQGPGRAEEPLSGEPVPIRFGDLVPTRNRRIGT
jgi:hypothetical protein